MFENIFSNKKQIESKTKFRIIADNHEKNSLVPAYLAEQGAEVEFKNLPVADYLIGETAVERKTASDFISSMINKRLSQQLQEIKQYKSYFLIIEGNPLEQDFENKNALRGFLLSILNFYRVPILYSKDEKETAIYLSLLAKKQEKESSLRPSKIIHSKKEQMQYILEGFENIGPTTAKKLLKKFKSLSKIFQAPKEELEKEIGKKAESFNLLEEEY